MTTNTEKILEDFYSCRSIRNTAWKYGMEMEELYELIYEHDGRRDGVERALDYKECRIEIIGRQEYDDELYEKLEFLKNNESEIFRIAENGYNNVLNNHTYKNRANQLIEIIKENL